ncbi:hypothetical protein GYH30_052773 [Glycine max]|nr:hypothetical protein GYH30_052773 [Glycine max]
MVSSEEEIAKASWRLNVKEFCLPSQKNDHQNHRSFTSVTFFVNPVRHSFFFFSFLFSVES